MKRLFVGNLPYSTTEFDLRALFAPHGEVTEAKIIMDHANGRSKGFGFVEMATEAQAINALDILSGTDYGGRPLAIKYANPRPERRPVGDSAARRFKPVDRDYRDDRRGRGRDRDRDKERHYRRRERI